MTVHIASNEDILTALTLADKFCKEAYGKWADDETVYKLVVRLLNDPDKVFLLYEDKGFLAGITNTFLLGPQQMAIELGWYVNPESRGDGVGKALIEAFEDWAKIMDCKLITMISIDDEVSNYYVKRGYKLYERTYMKEM